MNIAPAVSQWLSTEFPRPRVDPEWAQQCYDWLITEENLSPETDLQRIKDEMRTQILLSDLRDSMLQGTGIPTQSAGSNFSGFMGVKEHVLVQITSITDIGVSAFHLDQTRVAREERFQKGVVEGEEDGDVEVDEGPVPKYQRGMLAFQLTDGALNLEAIEYRPLQDFRLGETKLGLKLRLKNPLIRRGQVFLEPKNVEIVGGHTDELEEQQPFKFKRSLYKRLRLATPEPDEPRPPLAEIDGPPAPASSTTQNPASAHDTTAPMEIQEDDRPRRVPPSASPHFDRASSNTNTHTNLNLNLSPHPRPTVQHRSLAPARAGSDDSVDLDDDLELDEATLAALDKAEKDVKATLVKSSQTQVARSQTQRLTQTVINIDSDEDEDMDKENAAPMRAAKKGRGGGVFGSQNITVVDISDSE